MKELTTGMQATIDSGTLPLAWAIKITRPIDGVIVRFVSGTRDITLDGEAYDSQPNFELTSITCTLGFDVDTLEVTVLADSALEQSEFLSGRWNGAKVELNQYNWADPSDGFIAWPTYRIANVVPIVGGFKLELRDLRQLMRHDYTLTTGKTCVHRLGDALCQVDVAGSFTYSVTVSAVASRLVFTVTGLGQPTGWCVGGYITFDDGLYADMPLLVSGQTDAGVITLAEGDRIVESVVIGQTASITAGCRKRANLDCIAKFDNIINFLGARHAPSSSRLAGSDV